MSITVNTNMSSLICQRSLTKATSGMNTALQRMSTGLKINSAKDDAAGCAISSKMDYKLSSYGVAQDNAQMGQSMLDTASGSLSVMNNMLQRMRDLSEQAANGTYGKEERQAMQAEVDALTKELYRIKNTTDFNGKKVLGEEEYTGLSSVPDISMSEIDATDMTQYVGKTIGISSAKELENLATIVNAGHSCNGVNFALTGDINLDELSLDEDGSNFIPIGNFPEGKYFSGSFDGNNYTISNLKINTKKTTFDSNDDYQGLFSFASKTIKNINIENAEIKGRNFVGGLSGRCDYKVENCSVQGSIIGNTNVGGFCGAIHNWGDLLNCSSETTVVGINNVGGFTGQQAHKSNVTNCYTTSTVSGNTNVGGFIGTNTPSASSAINLIENCYSSSSVTTNNPDLSTIGGFIGSYNSTYDGCDVKNCYYDEAKVSSYNPIGSNTSGKTFVINNSSKNPFLKAETSKVNLQVGINSDENSVISVATGFEMGDFKISLNTEGGARIALDKIDAMMAKVNAKQLDIGATSNRLASTMEFQSVQMSALTSANSLIKDADIAKESASYIKNQILQQTTATLLATANQNPSIALSLV